MNIQQLMYGLKASVFLLLLPKKKIALPNYLELFNYLDSTGATVGSSVQSLQ